MEIFPTYTIIRNCTFINFRVIFLPARLFGLQDYSALESASSVVFLTSRIWAHHPYRSRQKINLLGIWCAAKLLQLQSNSVLVNCLASVKLFTIAKFDCVKIALTNSRYCPAYVTICSMTPVACKLYYWDHLGIAYCSLYLRLWSSAVFFCSLSITYLILLCGTVMWAL